LSWHVAAEGGHPESRTDAGEAYDELRADVLACRLHPGAKVVVHELAAQFAMSVGAIREALARLAAEGWIVARPQRGYWVAPVSIEELRDLTEARVEIETACLRRAIRHGTIEWEAALIGALHRLSRIPKLVPGDRARISDHWSQAHGAFHEALVAACDSRRLLAIRRQLYEQADRYQRLAGPFDPRGRTVPGEHDALAQAALARREAEAARLLEGHIRTTAQVITDAMERGWAEEDRADGFEARQAGSRTGRIREATICRKTGSGGAAAASRAGPAGGVASVADRATGRLAPPLRRAED